MTVSDREFVGYRPDDGDSRRSVSVKFSVTDKDLLLELSAREWTFAQAEKVPGSCPERIAKPRLDGLRDYIPRNRPIKRGVGGPAIASWRRALLEDPHETVLMRFEVDPNPRLHMRRSGIEV
ncbi:MAG: hypothetical protein ABIH26_06210 [Candidatus Eisenbacteria bacterium]